MPDDNDVPQDASEEEQILMYTLGIKKGKCPEDGKGIHHRLMKLAYLPRSIESIFDRLNKDLLYLFYTNCVSQSVGKRKWNQLVKSKPLSSFVLPADEAFAMLVLENNVPKWMNEVRFGKDNNSTYNYKTLYTEGKAGRKWNDTGKLRFLDLLNHCKSYRVEGENKTTYGAIESMILKRERATANTNNSYDENEDISSDDEVNDNDNAAMEEAFLEVANGNI